MIQLIPGIPSSVAAFRATGEVTKDDYEAIVVPEVDRVAKSNDELNFLMVLDTDVGNFTMGAWLQDLWVGIKHMTKWNRAAIVSDSEAVRKFTDGFSYAAPGEFRGFRKDEYAQAVEWVLHG